MIPLSPVLAVLGSLDAAACLGVLLVCRAWAKRCDRRPEAGPPGGMALGIGLLMAVFALSALMSAAFIANLFVRE